MRAHVRDVARHLRRLAEDHVERHVDRAVAEVRIVDDEPPLRVRGADDRERTALALADRAKPARGSGRDREHVALLRLVAPDLARRHARLFGRDRAQVERAADAAAVHELRQRVRQPARADVVDRQDRIARAELPAAVDHLLRAALDLGVAALHRIEIEVGGVRAGRHRRRGAAAHADQHARAAELHEQRAVGERLLVRVVRADVADAAGDHDRLVVAAHLAGDLLLERAEVAGEVRPAELVVERGGADRAFEHDDERRRDAVRLAGVRFPRLRRAPGCAGATR